MARTLRRYRAIHGASASRGFGTISRMPAVCARFAVLLGFALPVLCALGGCAGGPLASSPIGPSSSVASVWRSAPTRWFLEAPTIEVREEIGGARRVLVPSPDSAGAGGPWVAGWRNAARDEGALVRELADTASGTRVRERATAVESEDGALLLERVVEVVELPAGLELSMQLPLSMRGPSADAAASAHRVDWAVHGAPLGALWGEETHAVVLGRDEATRIALRSASPQARAPR